MEGFGDLDECFSDDLAGDFEDLDESLGDLAKDFGDLHESLGDGDLAVGDAEGLAEDFGDFIGVVFSTPVENSPPAEAVFLRGLPFPIAFKHGAIPVCSWPFGLGILDAGFRIKKVLGSPPSTSGESSVEDSYMSESWSNLQSNVSFTFAKPVCRTFFKVVPALLASFWAKASRWRSLFLCREALGSRCRCCW